MMTTRFFLLLEHQQKLDARLRLAEARRHAHPLELVRLRALERALRDRFAWLMHRPVLQPACAATGLNRRDR